MIEKTLHVGNLGAAFAVIATTAADLTVAGGASTFFGAALSASAIWTKKDTPALREAKMIAKDLETAIGQTHLAKDQDRLLRQMLSAYPPQDADFPAADMNGGKLTELLISRIQSQAKDGELRSSAALDAYRRVMPSVFQDAVTRTIATNESQSTMLAHLVMQTNASARADALRAAGVTDATIIGLAQRIVADIDDVGQAWLELQNAMDIAVRVQAEGRITSNHGDFVDTVLARVAKLSQDGDYATAGAEIDAALEQTDAQMVRLLNSGVELALLDRDTAKAATLLIRKADVDAGGAATFDTLRALQVHHYEIGRDKGINLESALAIDLAQQILTRAQGSDARGTALNDLGIALQSLGKRESGTARLEEAVTAYRAALQERTRERVPLNWATTQNNLGNALQSLGERESSTARLDEAVTAFRAALQVRTRARVPLYWATTQNNLGNALLTLGERESGTVLLEEAVTAYRAALQERTRNRVPLDWAMTQNNLGIALQTLGQRESGTVLLDEAVTAYRAALQEYTRERVPLDWAATQLNLSLVLSVLADRTHRAAVKQEALACAKGALDVYQDADAAYYVEKAERLVARIAQELSEFGGDVDTSEM